MIKKIISLFLVFLLVFTFALPSCAYGIKRDYAGHWAENSVQSWVDKGYIKGYSDGSVKPEGLVTRAEFIKLANNVFDFKETADISFTDVNKEEWYYREVQKACKAGYINGVSQTKFAPDDKLTREQAAVIIAKITKLGFSSAEEADIFNDSSKISGWAKGYVASAFDAHLLKGYTDNNFKPKNPIKRAEAIVTLDRTKSKMDSDKLLEELNDSKAIKILSIGNSFSEDSTKWLYDIAKSSGVDVIIGNVYYSGCTLEKHWSNAENNVAAYSYYKHSSDGNTKIEKQTMKDCIKDEKWDYITFQQYSGDSGLYNTFQPYLNNLISYVKGLSTNDKVKFALNMTWAYAGDSTNEHFINYSNNQIYMYNLIVNAYQQALSDTDIDIIIPCGTAIQNGRTNEALNLVGDELTRDGYHLNEGIGRYIAGLTFYEALIVKNKNIQKDLLKDVTFIPNTSDSNEYLAILAKIAAKNAVKNPFKITEIPYNELIN